MYPPLNPSDFILNLVRLHANMKNQPLYFAWHHPDAIAQAQATGQWFGENWPFEFLCSAKSPQELQQEAQEPFKIPSNLLVMHPGGAFQAISVPQVAFPELHQLPIMPGLENYVVEGGYVYLALDDVPLAVAMLEHPKSVEMLKGIASQLIQVTTVLLQQITAQREAAAINAIKQAFGEN